MGDFPKILVASPTASAKNYCFKEWLDNVMQFTYPNYEVRLFDNTDDGGKFTQYMNDYYKENYGDNDKFMAINTLSLHKIKSDSVIEKMSYSHNDCRDYCLENGYDYLFHLESDLFPQKNIIEELYLGIKPVIGALYYVDNGSFRKPMIQRSINVGEDRMILHIISQQFLAGEDLCFCDGNTKRVAHIGLGCVLISKFVLQKIKFRFVKGMNSHPDSYFAEDCMKQNIPIFIDTSLVVRHENQAWGIFGLDYK
jgi:hypothetical protein